MSIVILADLGSMVWGDFGTKDDDSNFEEILIGSHSPPLWSPASVPHVPMLCWPLYAEQKMNKTFMVEEYGVGVEVLGWQQGMVKAGELEAKVRLVM